MTDYRSRYPRLRFRDGGKVDLDTAVPYFEQAAVEAEWRAVGVTVEWLLTPRGRLDAALGVIVTPAVEKSGGSSAS